jgi:hypothetical protein
MLRFLVAVLFVGSAEMVFAGSSLLSELISRPFEMSAGNTYSFSFSSIDSVAWTSTSSLLSQTPNSSSFFIYSYDDVNALRAPDDAWNVRLYQGPSATSANLFAILGSTESYKTSNPYSWSLMNGVSANPGGTIEITMDSGSAQISQVGVSVAKDGTLYQKVFAFAIPEPSALSLFAIGLGGLAMMRRRRS